MIDWMTLGLILGLIKEGGEVVEKGEKLWEGGKKIAEKIVHFGKVFVGGAEKEEIEEELESRTILLKDIPPEVKKELEKKGVGTKISFTDLPKEIQQAIIHFFEEKSQLVETPKEWRELSPLLVKELERKLEKMVEPKLSQPTNQTTQTIGNVTGNNNIISQISGGNNSNIDQVIQSGDGINIGKAGGNVVINYGVKKN